MSKYVSLKTKRLIANRANGRCEYCRLHQDDSYASFSIDNIISQKHGGGDEVENLAFACIFCNGFKGPDIATIVDSYSDLTFISNPRTQNWDDHFEANHGEIIGKTKVGSGTVKLLQLNDPDRLILRAYLQEDYKWP